MTDRLFCFPDAVDGDAYHPTIAALLAWRRADPSAGTLIVEEWTVRPNADPLPSPDDVVEMVVEQLADISPDAAAAWDRARHDPAVLAAFRGALDVLAAVVDFMECDRLIDTREVTWDAAGFPQIDGQPVWCLNTSSDMAVPARRPCRRPAGHTGRHRYYDVDGLVTVEVTW